MWKKHKPLIPRGKESNLRNQCRTRKTFNSQWDAKPGRFLISSNRVTSDNRQYPHVLTSSEDRKTVIATYGQKAANTSRESDQTWPSQPLWPKRSFSSLLWQSVAGALRATTEHELRWRDNAFGRNSTLKNGGLEETCIYTNLCFVEAIALVGCL